MKKILLFLLCFLCGKALAEDFATEAVLLQALDKTTGRTSFLTVKVGNRHTYGDLSIDVEKCMKRPPEETPENSAFLIVSEKNGTEIFRGWMFSSNPALSGMDHPVYDIWVVECKSKATEKAEAAIAQITLDESDEVDPDTLED